MRPGWARIVTAAAGVGVLLGGCSLLAPSDDELLGGGAHKDGGAGTHSGGSGGKSGSGGSATGGKGGTATGGASTGGTSTGGTSTGGTSTGGTSTGGASTGGSGGSAGIASGGTGGASCPTTTPASPRAVTMYLLMDRSTSMQGQKWSDAVAGVNAFAKGSVANGVTLGMQYLQLNNGGCAGGVWETPEVPFAALPGNSQALGFALQINTQFLSNMNVEGPIHGSLQALSSLAQNAPDVQYESVFLTDANQISQCTKTVPILAQEASNGWPTVATYMIALAQADAMNILNPIAAGGGTVSSIDASAGSGSVQAALEASVRPCRFAIPNPDITKVSYSIDGNTLAYVPAHNLCNGPGWFDFPQGSSAVLCPDSCRTVQTGTGSVSVTVACP